MQDRDIVRPIISVFPYMRFAIDKGIETDLILKGTNLNESDFFDAQNEVLLSQEILMLRNLIAGFPAPETAWELGCYFYSRAHGILGSMMEVAPTVGEVFSCWIDYSILLNVCLRIKLKVVGGKIRLYAENHYDLPDDLLPFLVERDIIAGKTAIDYRLPGTFLKYATAVSFAHPPRTDLKKYHEYFLKNVAFNQSDSYVEIESASLSVPLPGGDPHKFELFRQQCQAEYSLRSQTRFFLTDTVRLYLQVEKGQAGLSDIAEKLNMSERSLRQKLDKEGSNFRTLRNQYIFQQSLNLLSKPELTIEEISYALGYSETCAFSRAFEKWTGVSPGRYRKKIIL